MSKVTKISKWGLMYRHFLRMFQEQLAIVELIISKPFNKKF